MTNYLTQLEKQITNLSVQLHTELSTMQQENDESMMELQEVMKLDTFEKLNHIQTVLQDLVRMVSEFKSMDEYQDFRTHEAYQRAMQKLENEIRNHIKIEQQLKLYIENTQSKLEQSEKSRQELEISTRNISEQIKRERRNSFSDSRGQQEVTQLRGTYKRQQQRIMELELYSNKLEQGIAGNKTMVQQKMSDLNTLQQRYDKAKKNNKENNPDIANSISEFYKRKYQEKCEQAAKLELKLRMQNTTRIGKQRTSKSPVQSRADRSPNMRRGESSFLQSQRKKILGRNGSIDKVRRSVRPSSSTQGVGSYYLNSSRR